MSEAGEIEWTELVPREIMNHIFQLVLAQDARGFAILRAVCKSWRRKLDAYFLEGKDEEYWERPHSPLVVDDQVAVPLLMSLLPNGDCHFYHPVYSSSSSSNNNALFSKSFPMLANAVIRYSKYGWLLLTRPKYNTHFFFNPTTEQLIEIGGVEWEHLDFMCFTCPPTSQYCCVVGIPLDISGAGLVHTYYQGAWELYDYVEEHGRDKLEELFNGFYWISFTSTPVVVDYNCYMLGEDGRVVVHDICNGSFFVLNGAPAFPPEVLRSERQRSYLVEDEDDAGTLLAVLEPNHREEDPDYWSRITVKKLNITNLTTMGQSSCSREDNLIDDVVLWEDVDLSDKMMFLGTGRCFLKKACFPGTGNKIYSPRIASNKGNCVFYSFVSHKYHEFFSNRSYHKPLHDQLGAVKQFPNSAWVDYSNLSYK